MEQSQEICQVIFSKTFQLSSVVKEYEVVRLPRFLRFCVLISQTCSNGHFGIKINKVMIFCNLRIFLHRLPAGVFYTPLVILFCFFLNLQVVVLMFAILVVKDYQTKLQQVKHKPSFQSQKKL